MKSKLVVTGLFLTILLFQQDIKAQSNIVKVNLTPLAIKNVSLQYERSLLKKFSVALGLGFIPDRPMPTYIPEVPGLKELEFSGFSITPEIRIYPLLKDSPRGFYIAPSTVLRTGLCRTSEQ